MDALRQIRFLIPPFFVLGAIALAAYTEPGHCHLDMQYLTNNLTTLIAVVVAGVLPLGFLISSLTFLLLDIFYRGEGDILQACLSDTEYDKINTLLTDASSPGEGSKNQKAWSASDKLSLIVNFDHGLVRQMFPGVADWSARTYSAFLVSANSIVALLIGGTIVLCANGLHLSWLWWLLMLALLVILILGTLMAWRDWSGLTRFLVVNYESMKTVADKRNEDHSSSRAQGSSPTRTNRRQRGSD